MTTGHVEQRATSREATLGDLLDAAEAGAGSAQLRFALRGFLAACPEVRDAPPSVLGQVIREDGGDAFNNPGTHRCEDCGVVVYRWGPTLTLLPSGVRLCEDCGPECRGCGRPCDRETQRLLQDGPDTWHAGCAPNALFDGDQQ